MKNNKAIHSLAQPNAKSGKITFVHSDGQEHSFSTCINRLSGSRLSWFDSDAPSVDDSMNWIKSVFRDIRAKSQKVVATIGDF